MEKEQTIQEIITKGQNKRHENHVRAGKNIKGKWKEEAKKELIEEVEKNILKIINNFQRNHKRVYDDEGNTDCPLVENEIFRVASKKEWLGNEDEWRKALKEQAEKDKNIRCYVCEFIRKLKEKK